MSTKRAFFLTFSLLLTVLLSAGCSLPVWPFQARVRFINHPEPNLASAFEPFVGAGCSQLPGYSYLTCPAAAPPFAQMGCTVICAVPGLGALRPDLPIMQCQVNSADRSQPLPAVYTAGCLMRQYVRYVVYQDGQFRLISTLEELRSLYAPIESREEALSYALAATGLKMQYNLKPAPMRYKVNVIEDTHVEEITGGYRVHLFHYQLCGCGPHGTSAVAVDVSRAGEVTQGTKVLLFEDPAQDSLCVD